jgi:hypothetical protein
MKHLSKIQQYLFYVILILLPFNIRHIFNFEQIKNIEGFRENISWSIYGFDIPFILLILTVFFTPIFQYMGVKKTLFENKKVNSTTYDVRNILLIVFIGWLVLNSLFAINKPAAFYNASRIVEAVLFFMVAKNLLQSREVLQKSALIIFLGGIFPIHFSHISICPAKINRIEIARRERHFAANLGRCQSGNRRDNFAKYISVGKNHPRLRDISPPKPAWRFFAFFPGLRDICAQSQRSKIKSQKFN